MKAQIFFQTKNNSFKISESGIQKLVNELIKYLYSIRVRNKINLKKKEIVIVFLDTANIKKINLKFRKKNKETDVLSFKSEDPNSLGEILICPQVILRQSKEHKVTFNSELGLMLIHGFLHLLDYDHEISPSEEKIMFKIQEKALNFLIKKGVVV